jgi:hypothetical protein
MNRHKISEPKVIINDSISRRKGEEEKAKLKKKTTKRANRTTGENGKRRNNQGTYNKREKKQIAD